MKCWAVVILMVALTGWRTLAQDGYPLPDELAVITPENAAQLERLAGVESIVMGEVAWSLDGTLLAAGTSAGVKLYDAADLSAPPRTFAGGKDVLLNPASDRLVSGGKLWDVETGAAVAEPGDSYWQQFSPSGDYLLTARFEDGLTTIYIWDSVTGAPHGTLETGSYNGVERVVFDTHEKRVALLLESYSTAANVQIWDVETGSQLSAFFGKYEDIQTVAFVADDRYLLADIQYGGIYGGPLGEIYIWDVETGETIYTLLDFFNPIISPDKTFALFDDHEGFYLFNLSQVYKPKLLTDDAGNPYRNLLFSPNGRYVVASIARSDTTPVIQRNVFWNLRDETLEGSPNIVLDSQTPTAPVAISPDSRTIAIKNGNVIGLWAVETWTQRLTLASDNFSSVRPDTRFSPDGSKFIVHTAEFIETWDVETGKQLNVTARYLDDFMRYSPTGLYMWDSTDRQVHLTDLITGVEIALPVIPDYLGEVRALDAVHGRAAFSGEDTRTYDLLKGDLLTRFSERSERALFNPDGLEVLLWPETNDRFVSANLALQRLGGSAGYRRLEGSPMLGLIDVRYSPSGDLLLAQLDNADFNRYALYEISSGKELVRWQNEGEKPLGISAFSPDGNLLVTASWEVEPNYPQGIRVIRLRDVALLKHGVFETLGALELRTELILDIVFSPNGKQIALSLDDPLYGDGPAIHNYRTLLLNTDQLLTDGDGDRLTQEALNPLLLPAVYAPRFSPDGKLLLTAVQPQYAQIANQITVWDATTGESITTLEGYHTASFSPDGELVVTFNSNTFAFWQTDTLIEGEAEPLVTFSAEDVRELAFSPDGSRLYIRSTYGVDVWGVVAS